MRPVFIAFLSESSHILTPFFYVIFLRTCVRFDGISRDPRYWLYVEGRRRPSSAGKVAYCEENLHKKTTYVMLAHNAMDKEALSPDFLELMNRFDRLNVLALENQKINGNKVCIVRLVWM